MSHACCLFLFLSAITVTFAQNFDPMQRWGYSNIPGWTCVDGYSIVGCAIDPNCESMSAQCFQSSIYVTMWYTNVNPCCYSNYCYTPSPNPGIAVCSWQSCAATTYWSTSSAANGGCTSCPAGSRCPGDFNAYVCPQGLFSLGGAADCTLCPPGTANPLEGQSTCPQCLPNTYSPGALPECIPCGPGTESGPGSSTCVPVPTPSSSSTGSSTSTSSASNSSTPSSSLSSSKSFSSTQSFTSSSSQTSTPISPQLALVPNTQYQEIIGSVGGVLGIASVAGWACAAYYAIRLRSRKNRKRIKISSNESAAMGQIYIASESLPLLSSKIQTSTLKTPLLAAEGSTSLLST